MRLVEYESKKLLKDAQIPIPSGCVVSSLDRIEELVAKFGGQVAIKAQIPVGGRKKAGGVKLAASADMAKSNISKLLGSSIKGYRVSKVLMEEQISIKEEFFLAVAYDKIARKAIIIISCQGGIDIEELAESQPEKLIKVYFDIREDFHQYQARQIVALVGLAGKDLVEVANILWRVVQLFLKYDATLLEVNPLAKVSPGNFVAVDAHIEIDDEALYRHPELQNKFGIPKREAANRPPSEFERKAALIDSQDYRGVAGRLIEFDGDMGLLIGGGGASLTVFDAIRRYGGRPANYCEIGGNPTVKKLCSLTKLILSQGRVKKIAVIMNVVSNTRVDLIARGVVKGVIEAGFKPSEKIAIFRVPGSWEDEGFKILSRYNVKYSDRTVSIDEAAKKAVAVFS